MHSEARFNRKEEYTDLQKAALLFFLYIPHFCLSTSTSSINIFVLFVILHQCHYHNRNRKYDKYTIFRVISQAADNRPTNTCCPELMKKKN